MADQEFICTWSKKFLYIPSVNPDKVLMPPLHIKLGLMRNFVKVLAKQNSNGFEFLCEKFTELSQAKLKEEIFVGPQILEVLKNQSLKMH